MMTETTLKNQEEIQLGKSKVLEGHKDCVRSIFVKDNLIISGSYDNTIRIWDIESCKCLKTLEGHKSLVFSVFVKDNLIISGLDDKTIRI